MGKFGVVPARLLVSLLGCVAFGVSADTAVDPVRISYSVVDLGLYGPSAINERHQIAIREQLRRTSLPSGETLSSHPFAAIWQSGTMGRLADAAEYTAAAGLNNDGSVVGYGPAAACAQCSATVEARLWHPDGRVERLPDLPLSETQPSASGSEARAINDRGEIAGWSFGYKSRGIWQRAARWRHGHVEPLGPDTGGSSAAFAINDVGDVVGWAEFAASADGRSPERAALWSSHASPMITDLGALGGIPGRSVAHDVNNARQVVGVSDSAAGGRRAFLWQRGAMSDLGTLGDDTDSEAFAVNGRGEVVGSSSKQRCGDCLPRAVRWIAGGIVDLNSEISANTGWHLMEAINLDDDGCIVGRGTLDGRSRYFLLQPHS